MGASRLKKGQTTKKTASQKDEIFAYLSSGEMLEGIFCTHKHVSLQKLY